MKRFLGIFMAGVLTISLAACGTNGSAGQEISAVADRAAEYTERETETEPEKMTEENSAEETAGKEEAAEAESALLYQQLSPRNRMRMCWKDCG